MVTPVTLGVSVSLIGFWGEFRFVIGRIPFPES
jgi:hypothetical protein